MLDSWREVSAHHAVAGLKRLAYERYAAGQYRTAANSCIRALGFAAQKSADEEGTQSPELWQLLSRIHATVGRHGAARECLDLAVEGMRSAGDGERLPELLRSGWTEAVASLSEDIDAGRWPESATSAYVPTTISGWLESPADVEPQLEPNKIPNETDFRIPANLLWRIRLTTATAASLWLLVISIPLGGVTAGLILLAIAAGGVVRVVLYVLSAPVAIIYVVALIWWARTWLRLALASWGGIGAFVGAAVSLIFIPALIWGLSSLAYDAGVWPVGAVLRILAWVWFAVALVGVWRWVTRVSPES